jgi:hypothetical protein
MADRLKNNFGVATTISTRIRIKAMTTVPDISGLMTLPRLASFSNFIPMHQQLASNLVTLFMGQ